MPFERGLQLCQEYSVVDLLQPILEYEATTNSPPLAPKHITAASNRPRKPREPRVPRPLSGGAAGTPKLKKLKLKGSDAQIQPRSALGVVDESGQPVEGDTDAADDQVDEADVDMTASDLDELAGMLRILLGWPLPFIVCGSIELTFAVM